MAAPEETPDSGLEDVRSELRRLGYLDHGFERFLLQDALRPRRPWRSLLRLSLKVSLLSSVVLAAALALALAAANGSLTATPLDLPVLFLHLFPPLFAAAALGFLVLCGVILLVLRLYHVRRIEALSLAAALTAGIAVLAGALLAARGLVLGEGRRELLLVLAIAAPLAAAILVRLVYQGLLTLAISFTDSPPGERLFSRRGLGFAILAMTFLLALPLVLSVRRTPPYSPPALPSAPGDRVLLLGIDGVLPEEVDYLMALGDLPAMAGLARQGGRVLGYPRKDEPPASFWTAVATGVPGPAHGVTSLDSFRPLGTEVPLARNGPLRLWWNRVEVPLGLAEYRPVLANRRRAFTVWELAARGGFPVLAVNWWGTFPVESPGGPRSSPRSSLIVAHGAFQLLEDGAAGTIAPETSRKEAENLVRGTRDSKRPDGGPGLAAAMPPAAASSVLERAVLPDRFYREIFERGLAAAPRAAALYLPALDIAADGWRGGDVAFADLVRAELKAADGLLARELRQAGDEAGFGTVVVVLDPGRRRSGAQGRGQGRVLLWRRTGCGGRQPRTPGAEIPPEAVASGLLRALGLPQSEELPPPPAACRWPPPPVTVAGYGEPRARPDAATEGGEYLESLRSLGYL